MILGECIIDHKIIFPKQNIVIEEKKWTCITGQSGIGKTTLLRCLAGLVPGFKALSENLSYMPQNSILLPWKTIEKNVQINDLLTGKKPKNCLEILKSVGLESCVDLHPHQLSFGMQKRVLLAQILYNKSDFVLLDEPFAGIDPKTRQELYLLCKKHLSNTTVLHVTHDLCDIEALANVRWHLSGSPAYITNQDTNPQSI